MARLLPAPRAACGAPEAVTTSHARGERAEAVTTSHVLGERVALVAEPAMHELYRVVGRLARTQLPVLVQGESGVGKENVAAAIHAWSARSRGPLVALNCAALQEGLIESELFGYERGAFSGAVAAKAGLLERASGGTLFLDEVPELSAAAQAKLLRVLEARRVTRLGGVRERAVDLRLVAATNRALLALVREGRFRHDLYFRLSGATLEVPPLRQRPLEIVALARHFAKEAALEDEALRCVLAYAWPGNVRELRHAMEYAAALADGGVIAPCHLPAAVRGAGGAGAGAEAGGARSPEGLLEVLPEGLPEVMPEGSRGVARALADPSSAAPVEPLSEERTEPVRFLPLAEELRALERRRMAEALRATGGVQRRAAALLGMPVRTFTCKLAQYGLRSER